ncbi:serine/threonine-protein kinase 19 isoform X2 [Meleagris gallopavo]|uniref:serine/threonine-protein kinase 19 isoform X2 n=1 Tax=Meleagris gallopavo TaxID=9103 RepID=UPI0012AB4339|nr:serine/threonine-protein kinase 19 isoform X2 [Meleagris gallopavo]
MGCGRCSALRGGSWKRWGSRTAMSRRKQLLAAVRRSRHREVLQAELGQRRARPSLGLRYVLLDLLGAELLRSVPTTSGPLLRLAET